MLSVRCSLKKDILSIVDSYTIYSFYYPELDTDATVCSPLRNDTRPSFAIRYGEDGSLFHKDYGDDDYRGDCFNFVGQMFNISYSEALRKVDTDLGLGISSGNPIREYEIPERPPIKERKIRKIEVETREFTQQDLDWWGAYHITYKDLIREHIYSVQVFYMENKFGEMKRMYKDHNELCFAYKFFNDDKHIGWKIYFPERENFKWFASVPNTTMEGMENITSLRRLIITKSRKDRIALSKILPNVINSQNESRSFLTEEYRKLFSHFREVYIWFDSDEPGVKACKKITEEMGWKYINTPTYLLEYNVKDPAAWIKLKGQKDIKLFLKQKRIL